MGGASAGFNAGADGERRGADSGAGEDMEATDYKAILELAKRPKTEIKSLTILPSWMMFIVEPKPLRELRSDMEGSIEAVIVYKCL